MTNAYTPCNAEDCDRSPANGDVLYRVAPKGEKGPWACEEHVMAEREAWAVDPRCRYWPACQHLSTQGCGGPQATTDQPAPGDEGRIEVIAAKVHEAWMETKRAQGVESRPSEWGEEQMVPYADLTERAKDLDRSTVQAVLDAIVALGLTLASPAPAATEVGEGER